MDFTKTAKELLIDIISNSESIELSTQDIIRLSDSTLCESEVADRAFSLNIQLLEEMKRDFNFLSEDEILSLFESSFSDHIRSQVA